MTMTNDDAERIVSEMAGEAAGRRANLAYEQITDDQAADGRQQLLRQRLANLEAEHVGAVFAVEQIERQIQDAREQLAGDAAH